MKKQLLSAVLVLLMLVAFVPVTAAAEEGKLYGEMPIYLGFPDVDYMAEEILKELDLAEKTAEERIFAVYEWVVTQCSNREAEALYFDVAQVLEQAEGDFREQVKEAMLAGELVTRVDIASTINNQGNYPVGTYDTNYYVAQFASQMMLYRSGNGAHFAALLTVLLNHLGYDCRLIDGELIAKEEEPLEHKWNMVLVDGTYYWLDAYLEHLDYVETEVCGNRWFMVNDDALWEEDHLWDASYPYALKICASDLAAKYEQYTEIPQQVQDSVVDMVLWRKCSEWAEPFLQKSLEKEIFPDVFVLADMRDDVTRGAFASVAVMFYEALSGETAVYNTEKGNPFTDVENTDLDVLLAYQLGIVNGMSETKFDPNGTLTRAQAVTMLGRVVELVHTGEVAGGTGLELEETEIAAFHDQSEIGDWAAHYVAWFVSHGVVNGMPDGRFAPNENMTCEQAMKVAVEALNQ